MKDSDSESSIDNEPWDVANELPVHAACENGDADALRRALANGVSPELPDYDTFTPLMLVVYHGDRPDLISILLSAGADPNARSAEHDTMALHIAVNSRQLNCIPVLIAGGASLTLECDGTTPVECISGINCRRILAMLLKAGSPMPRLGPHGYRGNRWLCMPGTEEAEPFTAVNYPMLCEYRGKVVAAGGWAAYEKTHCAKLPRAFVPKFPQIPAGVVPTIVAFAFHTGWY